MSASRLRPSSRWCADWQAWVQHNVNAAPSRFNAVGAQAEACEERLTLHASIADSINEWTATSRVSLLFKRVSGSSDADVITAAGEHASLVAGLAATQIDRQALSLRSNAELARAPFRTLLSAGNNERRTRSLRRCNRPTQPCARHRLLQRSAIGVSNTQR